MYYFIKASDLQAGWQIVDTHTYSVWDIADISH